MARLPRLYAEGFAQLAQARFTHHADAVVRQSFSLQFADIGRWLRLALADTDTLLHGWVVTPSSLTLLATPGDETSLARSILGPRRGSEHGKQLTAIGPCFRRPQKAAVCHYALNLASAFSCAAPGAPDGCDLLKEARQQPMVLASHV